MMDCKRCGSRIAYQSQPHTCRNAYDPTVRKQLGPPVYEDTERRMQQVALEVAIQNAAANAESLIERGYSPAVALIAAISPAVKVAGEFGFVRGYEIGRNFSFSKDTVSENQHDDPGTYDECAERGRQIPNYRNDRFTSDNGHVRSEAANS